MAMFLEKIGFCTTNFIKHILNTWPLQRFKDELNLFTFSVFIMGVGGKILVDCKFNRPIRALVRQVIQSAKILLLPPKYEIIICHPIIQFSNIAIAILDFSLLLLVKLSLLILFASFLVSVLCFFFIGFLSKVIALPTIAIAIVLALSRS